MPTDIPVAFGVIIAALITASVAFLGLIISKEQKTSEFRQAWIDALRSELTIFLSHINAVVDGSSATYGSEGDRTKDLLEKYAALNEANFAIQLRLNPDEQKSKEIISLMSRFHQLYTAGHLTPDKVRPIEASLLHCSRVLLKEEWTRVKRGEPLFVLSKIVVGFIALGALILALLIWNAEPRPASMPAKQFINQAKN